MGIVVSGTTMICSSWPVTGGASAYAAAFSREEDAGVTEDFEQAERCLLLVAATRAKRYLAVLQRS